MTEPVVGAFVVGTAGHIDHGKSTLVKALTSIDPDRLEEEDRIIARIRDGERVEHFDTVRLRKDPYHKQVTSVICTLSVRP